MPPLAFASRYHPNDLLLEWLHYGETRPQRELPKDHGLRCAGTTQSGMDNQVPCRHPAKVAAQIKDVQERGRGGEFPLCGLHARRNGIFVIPRARLA